MLSPAVRSVLAGARANARRMATNAVQTASVAPRGFMESMFFDTATQPSLDVTLAGLPEETGVAQPATELEVSTLSNGVTVASQDSHGHAASVGISVRGGSRLDVVPGTAFVLSQFAFTNTLKRSAFRYMRDVENFGGAVGADADRESILYTGVALRDELPLLFDALAETITQPRLETWDVDEHMQHWVGPHVGELLGQGAATLQQAIMASAYGGASPLGSELVPSTEGGLLAINGDVLRAYLSSVFRGGNIVVTGNNVPHAALVELGELCLGGVPAGKADLPASPYTGGECVIRNGATDATAAVTFAAPAAGSADAAAASVLTALIGSAPDKHPGNVYSRAARLCADANSPVETCTAFNFAHSDSGVVGVAAACQDGDVRSTTTALMAMLKDIAAGNVDAREVTRAKAKAKMQEVTTQESRDGRRAAVAQRLIVGASDLTVAGPVAAIEAVSGEDVVRVAKAALASKPSFAATGALADAPSVAEVAAM